MRHVLLLLLGAHLAYARKHSLKYFYTGVSGIDEFPELTVVGLVNDEQFMYFDSNTMKAVPKTEWIRQNVGADYWDSQTRTDIGQHQYFKNNIQVAKARFNQTTGVHTFQQMYGCEFDDQTGATNGFRQLGYDGENFLDLDFKQLRWISPVQQGFSTVQKWNNNRALLESDKQYFSTECIEWLKKYLQYGKSSLEKTVSPQVSLLQKSSSSSVTCHATGFYPSGVKITWMRNDQEHHEDVEVGELLPNEDGTFQKKSTIRVTPDEWKNNKYSCVVEHQGKTKTANEIRTNPGASVPIGIIVGAVAAVILLVIIGVAGFMVYQKKKGFKPVNASDDGSNSSTHSDPKA
ncbi:major histocompatibility complex class I-related gene protein-like [Onychostoma macrolepis]|uniref:major histocompatibility complex class I-related gene protein-like n=1 Tax=Onychostoma macrolepis TaxID=369639 RepID=UPI00272C8596|nr:major histocompatibility complex class I-related gene protein-like [Onychostoma macrolepis]